MQTLRTSAYSFVARLHCRGILNSHDCSDEFSLYHWLYVCKLVADADISQPVQEEPAPRTAEASPKKPVSEVEPSTTYEHLTGNVV